MDGGRTTKRQYSEYSDFFSTQREPEYDQNTEPHLRGPTQVRRGGRETRSGLHTGLQNAVDTR